MKALITGITGMIGSHLADLLVEQDNIEIFGFKRWRSNVRHIKNLTHRIEILEGDVEDSSSVEKAIGQVKPDGIFHLAAQAYHVVSWDAPITTLRANVIGTANVLEAVRKLGLQDTKIVIACSSAEYGFIRKEDVPITEEHPLHPVSPYGVSKVAQELLGFQYWKSYGFPIVMPRIFNQIGPRHTDFISVQNFCKQVAMIEKKIQPPIIRVGNLSAQRDFLDVRDCARALWALLKHGKPGEAYNICSGKAFSIQQMLDMILELSTVEISVETDPARFRPADEPILMGDNSKLRRDTEWKPTIPLEKTLLDTLEYWRREMG